MILITIGTIQYPFERMTYVARSVYEQCSDERIIIQSGHTAKFDQLRCDNVTVRSFIPQNELWQLMSKADVLLMHGGEGSLLDAIEMSKYVPIVFPRDSHYGEHVDDYQLSIAREAEKRGLCQAAYVETEAISLTIQRITQKIRPRNKFRSPIVNKALIHFLKQWMLQQ